MRSPQVLYEDDGILILDKPSGLAVQGGEGVGVCLVDLLERERGLRPLLVHRLDRDTSGCILVAKTSAAAARYSRLIAGKEARKVYGAICSGCPEAPQGSIDLDIQVRGEAKEALTHYRVLAANGAFSLLELELDTGRTHQLRIHLAAIGHPILGDDRHGDFPLNRRLRKERGLRRLLLHARRLELPSDGGSPDLAVPAIIAPWPEAFLPYLSELGIPAEPQSSFPPQAPRGSCL